MTLEILISTPNHITLASDTAVTIKMRKTYTGSKKIAQLSESPQMAIMYYGNADFGSKELEILIKEFIEKIDFTKVNSVKKIKKEFINFLNNNTYPNNVEYFLKYHFGIFKRDMGNEISKIKTEEDFWNFIELEEKHPIFSFIDKKKFLLTNLIPEFVSDKTKANEMLLEIFSKELSNKGTGIIIAGFDKGNDRPSYTHFSILFNNNGKVEYVCHDEKINYSSVSLISFAQNNDVNNYINGIDPQFEDRIINFYNNEFNARMNEFKKFLIESKDFNKETIEKIDKNFKIFKKESLTFKKEFKHKLNKIKNEKYYELLSLIQFLPKNELAKFAKFLIELTSYKKHYSYNLDTVGNDVDVCILTKVDSKWASFKKEENK